MKGLRLKAETTVGTETTRWVSDRSKRLMGPKRPVTDDWGVLERETVCARNDLFVARFARLENWEKNSGKSCYPDSISSSEFVNFAFNIFFTVL